MAETNEEKVEDIEEVEEIVPTKDEFDNDTTDWQALGLKYQGISKRLRTKLLKLKEDNAKPKEEPAKEPEKPQDKKEFDYAEKAFLKASDIKADEFPFVLEVMQSTGKTLEQVLDSKYFQSELKEKRELSASAEAVPEGTPRGGGGTRDSKEYWLAKGELPPIDQPKLRREVVNARMEVEKARSKFSDNPVV